MLSVDTDSNQPVVVVTQCELANHPPFGLVSRVQVTLQYVVHILMRKWESGELDGRESIHAVCIYSRPNLLFKFHGHKRNLNTRGNYRFDSTMRYLSLIEAIALYRLIFTQLY